jgi:hypothetical protein
MPALSRPPVHIQACPIAGKMICGEKVGRCLFAVKVERLDGAAPFGE